MPNEKSCSERPKEPDEKCRRHLGNLARFGYYYSLIGVSFVGLLGAFVLTCTEKDENADRRIAEAVGALLVGAGAAALFKKISPPTWQTAAAAAAYKIGNRADTPATRLLDGGGRKPSSLTPISDMFKNLLYVPDASKEVRGYGSAEHEIEVPSADHNSKLTPFNIERGGSQA